MTTDIISLTIKKAQDLLEKKEISAVELTDLLLQRIEHTKDLNAYITVCEDDVRQYAKDADEKRSTGDTNALLGIPLSYKDAYNTKGILTTAASKVLGDYIAPYDATAVVNLKKAGAGVLGKMNMDAWAHGSSGENSDYGPAKNPYDLSRTPGGSSSGSAAAVAAGSALAATGTDTGGSIRLPAGFTNTVGLKPTYGRVSRYGIVAMGSSFDSIGHITKTVEDSAILLEVTAGKDEHDATTSDIAVPKYTEFLGKSIKGMKIGIIKECYDTKMHVDIKKSLDTTIAQLESLGAVCSTISLPHIDYAMACYYILVPAEVSSNLGRYDGIRYGNGRDQFSDEAKRRIMTGTFTLSSGYYDAYYKKATEVRAVIRKDFTDAFAEYDVLLAPSSPTVPFVLGEKTKDPLEMYLTDVFVCPMNLAQVPAITVPMAEIEGLPVGVQFVAPHFKEELLFQVGSAYEAERGSLDTLQLKI